MERDAATASARKIMQEFARETGLEPASEAPRRYLWTDAFAVCNFLELHRRTGDVDFLRLAAALIDQVHQVLGRHRGDDPRSGWISGLDEQEGRRHPTAGGLRIGKPMKERGPEEPLDEGLEWERDGQYYHYLTRWMHALDRMSQASGEGRYRTWARELARAAHAGFVLQASGGKKRMAWKMSIDLTTPLVPSTGHHDPLDGLITFRQLQAEGDGIPPAEGPDLSEEIADLEEMCRGKSWATDDPLGTGGLLADTCRVARLLVTGNIEEGLLKTLLEDSLSGVQAFASSGTLRYPPEYRLGFRELGLAIGLGGIDLLGELMRAHPGTFGPLLLARMKPFERHRGLAEEIENFWMDPAHRETESWEAHRDINEVMLATGLLPDGFLGR